MPTSTNSTKYGKDTDSKESGSWTHTVSFSMSRNASHIRRKSWLFVLRLVMLISLIGARTARETPIRAASCSDEKSHSIAKPVVDSVILRLMRTGVRDSYSSNLAVCICDHMECSLPTTMLTADCIAELSPPPSVSPASSS